MKKWAIIIDSYVMEFKFSDEKPKYPPDPKGNEVLSIECDDTVKLGMFYENGEFLWKEPDRTPPEPTQLDRIEAAVNKSQQDIIDNYTLELIEMGVL